MKHIYHVHFRCALIYRCNGDFLDGHYNVSFVTASYAGPWAHAIRVEHAHHLQIVEALKVGHLGLLLFMILMTLAVADSS